MTWVPQSFQLIQQGAESVSMPLGFFSCPQRVYKADFCGRPAIVKERFRKMYRIEELDEKLSTKRLMQALNPPPHPY
jgi:tRNA A-37 threonylcarbamoyl transferase component Bud32